MINFRNTLTRQAVVPHKLRFLGLGLGLGIRIRIRVRHRVRVRVRLGMGLGLGFSSSQSWCVPPYSCKIWNETQSFRSAVPEIIPTPCQGGHLEQLIWHCLSRVS